jgi:hypothetical protein
MDSDTPLEWFHDRTIYEIIYQTTAITNRLNTTTTATAATSRLNTPKTDTAAASRLNTPTITRRRAAKTTKTTGRRRAVTTTKVITAVTATKNLVSSWTKIFAVTIKPTYW